MNSDPPFLSGTIPGLLDPSQPFRLLRTPSTRLFFADFNPLTARASDFPNLSSLNLNPGKAPKRDNPNPVTASSGKRIVIETDPENGTCSWRFVPRAKTERVLLGDEGSFPRLVKLCGRVVRMSLDQWDIYKLDPEYDCVVHAHPYPSTITRVAPKNDTIDLDNTFISDTPLHNYTSTPKTKRGSSPTRSDTESSRRKRYKSTGVKRTFSSQTDNMSVDEDPSCVPDQAKDQDKTNGKKRRWAPDGFGGRNVSEAEKLNGKAPEHRAFADGSQPNPNSGGGGINDISNNDIPAKKARTRSPSAVRRELGQKRTKREKKRRARLEARLKFRRDFFHRAFWDGLGVPPELHKPGSYENPIELDDTEDSESSADESDAGCPSHGGPTTDGEEEAERLAKIEESRRKLAELEKDKPLWEESARRRQAKEKEEEQMRRRMKLRREEAERQRQYVLAARRQREEKREKERQEREREIRVREQSRRMFVPPRPRVIWSSRHALDRYLETAAKFDTTKFSAGATSVTFAAIPWPVLHSSFSVQDIDWDAVERFFGNVQRLLSTEEFKDLVEKSQRRFHPDRWRSRGILLSVKDDTERDLLEVTGSTVAQAITPLWKKVTGR